jgi:hypothetical protein
VKSWRVTCAVSVSLASILILLDAAAHAAQAKSGVTAAVPASSDPAIRWQFDTHG